MDNKKVNAKKGNVKKAALDKTSLLEQVSAGGWLHGISDAEISSVIELSTVKKFGVGEFIYMVGDEQQNLFCILDGQVSISIIDPRGEEFVLTIWETGGWFGEAAFHQSSEMPLEARAKTEVTVLLVPIPVIDTVLSNGATFYRNIMIDMVGRAKLLYKLVETLLFRPLRARVAMRILHLVELFGQQEGDSIVLPFKISQSDIARMSGGSRQRVNQIFRDWSDKGFISKENKRYMIHNIDALTVEMDAIDDE